MVQFLTLLKHLTRLAPRIYELVVITITILIFFFEKVPTPTVLPKYVTKWELHFLQVKFL